MSATRAIAYLLRPDVEGRYIDDPDDPGLETNRGISKRAYPNEDIKGMTDARASVLYERDYWAAIHGDELPEPVAFALMDFAVNSGVPQAVHSLQRVLSVTQDGLMGAQTIRAANTMNTLRLIPLLSAERLVLMASSHLWEHEGHGWSKRVVQTALEAFQ